MALWIGLLLAWFAAALIAGLGLGRILRGLDRPLRYVSAGTVSSGMVSSSMVSSTAGSGRAPQEPGTVLWSRPSPPAPARAVTGPAPTRPRPTTAA